MLNQSDMKLKTAIEYWDFINNILIISNRPFYHIRSETARIYNNYIGFLKQPLQLWMFIPCDKEGKPLDDPKKDYSEDAKGGVMYQQKVEEYQQACDRRIFNGFEWFEDDDYIHVHLYRKFIIIFDKEGKNMTYGIDTINDLSGKVDLVEKVAKQFKYE